MFSPTSFPAGFVAEQGVTSYILPVVSGLLSHTTWGDAQTVNTHGSDSKELACNTGDLGWILGQENPLEKGMGTHSSVLAWKIPWTEEPGGLQSMGSQRVRHGWVTNTHAHTRPALLYLMTYLAKNFFQDIFFKIFANYLNLGSFSL